MSRHDVATRLRHMVDAAERAVSFCRDRSRRDLDNDDMLRLALLRLLEVLGEAARHVPSDVRELAPAVAWRQIIGTRDRLIHGYDNVSSDIIWSIVRTELLPLIAQLRALIARIEARRT